MEVTLHHDSFGSTHNINTNPSISEYTKEFVVVIPEAGSSNYLVLLPEEHWSGALDLP